MGERINSYKELRVFQNAMNAAYDQIMGQIVNMINEADKWLIK
jgi:hypothetical protein